jgi:spore maturation protein SpmB
MKLNRMTTVALAILLALSGTASSALAQDQRTTGQNNATVKVITKIPSTSMDAQIKQLAKMIGLKVRHSSKKVWLLTGQPRQIQQFQRMSGGLGLTLTAK